MLNYSPKILVTGAAGQLGQTLAQHQPPSAQLHACTRTELDITDLNQVKTVLASTQPDVVINAAAFTAVDKAESEQATCLAINEVGPQNLAKICEAMQIPLIHLSTDYVFSGKKASPYLETDETDPINYYGLSKQLGEEAVRNRCEKHLILRVSGLFSQYGQNFVKTMLRLLAEKPALRVVADQTLCPTSTHDIAKTLWTLATQKLTHWGTYHYASREAVSWFGFTQAIAEIAGRNTPITPITTAEYPTPAKRPAYSALNCDKIHRDYGVEQPDWRAGLRVVI